MSLHYQVFAKFQLSHGKPRLLSTAIFSTSAAFITLPLFENSALNFSRIFPTLKTANSYIEYLQKVHQYSPTTPPVLDNGQKYLFSEVSK
ncbi:MAG: hypothetical protein LBC76_09010 [Treponema sp.]|jgi:hypothetical protein|nr:hypothetical protein [Treponema sp.]